MPKRKRDKEKGDKKKKKTSSLLTEEEDQNEDFFIKDLFSTGGRNYSNLKLKPDHDKRPIWICPDKLIYLETFSPLYRQAYDFLIAVAEPVSRPRLIQEYRLTDYSLYAAVSVGLSTETILTALDRLSKSIIPPTIEQYIKETTKAFGQVSLVLRKNRFFLESEDPRVLLKLLTDPVIKNAQKITDECDKITGFITTRPKSRVTLGMGVETEQNIEDALDEGVVQQQLYSFEVNIDHVDVVKKHCLEANLPALQEYDFANDTENVTIPLDLKPSTTLRPYQEKSLSKMFGNGRARSGIIVLPCGAGKTLVGITATCTVKKRAIVLTSSAVAAIQWKNQFIQWADVGQKSSNVNPNPIKIVCFTSLSKEFPKNTEVDIVITTYQMVTHKGHRSEVAQAMLNYLKEHEWGLLVLDEVHVVPAATFREVFVKCAAHCKLGLSATLVREDDKIKDLYFLIGSKLYEANWLDLSREGHIAKVSCAEIWCDMTPEFYQRYLETKAQHKKLQLYVMNPNKFRTCQFLINYHESRNDKIIVFSDDVFALRHYATQLRKHYIYGQTTEAERNSVLEKFKYDDAVKTVFISKIGDQAIDLPDANVLIQISFHFGARRQEAQRLGRILRAKSQTEGEFNAFFYTLVSKDTEEMAYCTKRQQFLINQGYAFKVISHIPEMANHKLMYETRDEQLKLLSLVVAAECVEEKFDDNGLSIGGAVRKSGNSKSLSGASGQAYSTNSIYDRRHQLNPLFKLSKRKKLN